MLKKIKSWLDKKPCLSSSHNPPSHLYIPDNGIYEWKCPDCGGTTLFEVNRPTF